MHDLKCTGTHIYLLVLEGQIGVMPLSGAIKLGNINIGECLSTETLAGGIYFVWVISTKTWLHPIASSLQYWDISDKTTNWVGTKALVMRLSKPRYNPFHGFG